MGGERGGGERGGRGGGVREGEGGDLNSISFHFTSKKLYFGIITVHNK